MALTGAVKPPITPPGAVPVPKVMFDARKPRWCVVWVFFDYLNDSC